MVYRPSVDNQLCFVLLPLRAPFIGYFEKIIKPAALEAGLSAVKADDIYGTRAVIRDIWESIWKARVVVAIVSGKNPNVNYELGICHSLGIPTVLITERSEDVPFDYRHRRYISYKPREAGWEEKLRMSLSNTLKAALTTPSLDDELAWPYDTFRVADTIGSLRRSEDAREFVVLGAQLVSKWIAPAFGPHGDKVSVAIPRLGAHRGYRRGLNIADGVKAARPLEIEGIEQTRRLAREVFAAVGDATKTAIFLCTSLLEGGDAALRAGHRPKYLISGMQRAVETAVAALMTMAKPASSKELHSVAVTACGGDRSVANAVLYAFERAGKDGIVGVVDGSGGDLVIDVQEGMQFDRGYLSDKFVTDSERQEAVFEDCYILIYEKQISSMRDLLPILEQVAKSKKPLLVISTDIVQEALATLILNKQKGTLQCAAVKAPGSGDRRRAILDDIAILTGGKAFLEDLMRPLEEVSLRDLGLAKKVIVTKDSTTIVEGAGVRADVERRMAQLRKEIERTRAEFEQEKLRERLANLGGAMAIIRSTGSADDDKADSRYKIESALHSYRSAAENGWLPGGGTAYCRAKKLVSKLVAKNETEQLGIDIVSSALESPILRLMENSRAGEPQKILTTMLESETEAIGFDAERGEIEDLVGIGVLDPANTLKEALVQAFTYAEGILKTGAWDTTSTANARGGDEHIDFSDSL